MSQYGIDDRDYIRAVDMINVGDDSRIVAAMANHMTAMDEHNVHGTMLYAREMREIARGSPYISDAPLFPGQVAYGNWIIHNPSLFAPPGYFRPY